MKLRRLAAATTLGVAALAVGAAGLKPELALQAEFARLRWLADAEVQQMQVAGHRVVYLQAGRADAPLLVLAHGFTGSKENWLALIRELARDYRVIAPDLPGWGESERQPSADYGPGAQAQRLAAFLAALPQRPHLLVGHSMGGQIVGLLAARQPDIAERICLMSAAGVRFHDNEFGKAVLEGRNPFEVRNRADLDRYLGIVFSDPPFVPWPADRALIARRQRDALFEQQVLDAIGRGPEAFALQEEMGNIAVPTLLLWCRDDQVIDVSSAEIFHQGLRQSQTVILAGCGHMPMMAQPAQVAEALRAFSAR